MNLKMKKKKKKKKPICGAKNGKHNLNNQVSRVHGYSSKRIIHGDLGLFKFSVDKCGDVTHKFNYILVHA